MPAERLERGDRAPVRVEEIVRAGDRPVAGQLVEHLALLRPAQVERVEEARDLVLVRIDDLDAVEPAVDLIEDGPRWGCCVASTVHRLAAML